MDETRDRKGAPARTALRADERLDTLLGYNLRRASAFALNDFVVEFSDLGLRPVSYGMLSTIAEQPGISATELCRILGMKRANMAPLITELEEQGLIARVAHEEDRRVQLLFLTPRAEAEMPRIRARIRQHENRFLHRLSRAERGVLLDLLRRIWAEDED
jgi:DNA-binding MarR family transcriptional regulator